MCGRFSLSPLSKIILEERFDVVADAQQYVPRYNCAPGQELAVISNAEPLKISYMRWGLIPQWSRGLPGKAPLINARAETIEEKPSFRTPFRKRRCLVPADSFYEWKLSGGKKMPYRILIATQPIFAMAGIWDSWKSVSGDVVHSFSILTTVPNELMAEIHHRMPVILAPEEEKRWLEEDDPDNLRLLLKPFPADRMTAYPVSQKVNNSRNDSADICNPVHMG